MDIKPDNTVFGPNFYEPTIGWRLSQEGAGAKALPPRASRTYSPANRP